MGVVLITFPGQQKKGHKETVEIIITIRVACAVWMAL